MDLLLRLHGFEVIFEKHPALSSYFSARADTLFTLAADGTYKPFLLCENFGRVNPTGEITEADHNRARDKMRVLAIAGKLFHKHPESDEYQQLDLSSFD